MLTFIGLGLYDKTDVSVKGLALIKAADVVFLECYTSRIMGSTLPEMETFYGKTIRPLLREDVEQDPKEVLELAKDHKVVFLCAGDPMVSTTHADLRLRAAALGIPTSIVHAASISSAVCGLSGLQNYRFGKSCSLPFPRKNWYPTSAVDVIAQNLSQRLHTLVFLDIDGDRYMTVPEAVALIRKIAAEKRYSIPLYVGIARAGSDEPLVRAGPADVLEHTDFGSPLHILVIPADLHDMERTYLETFAGL